MKMILHYNQSKKTQDTRVTWNHSPTVRKTENPRSMIGRRFGKNCYRQSIPDLLRVIELVLQTMHKMNGSIVGYTSNRNDRRKIGNGQICSCFIMMRRTGLVGFWVRLFS